MGSYGQVTEVSTVLSPIELEAGMYEISLSREGDNLYKVYGEDIYIKTRYCMEMALGDEAILKIESITGFTLGKLIFP